MLRGEAWRLDLGHGPFEEAVPILAAYSWLPIFASGLDQLDQDFSSLYSSDNALYP